MLSKDQDEDGDIWDGDPNCLKWDAPKCRDGVWAVCACSLFGSGSQEAVVGKGDRCKGENHQTNLINELIPILSNQFSVSLKDPLES